MMILLLKTWKPANTVYKVYVDPWPLETKSEENEKKKKRNI